MTDIKQKALALLNDVRMERGFAPVGGLYGGVGLGEALCHAIEQIEQHEAFRQEVSDIVHHYVYASGGPDDWEKLKALIIPKPKSDPLVEIIELLNGEWTPDEYANAIRAALEARGLKIREKGK